MKHIFFIILLVLAGCKTQTLQTVLDSSGLNKSLIPTTQEINLGLKEALSVSIEKGARSLAQKDGYFKDSLVKILLPNELKEVEKTLKKVGLGVLTDELTLKLNRAAEDAALKSIPIFKEAILAMSFNDVMSILKGNEDSATKYLKGATSTKIGKAFAPEITNSLNKVGATDIWKKVFDRYNSIPFVKKVNPDLVDYTTQKALSGLFVNVSSKEKDIRKDLKARTSPLLRKVFSYAETL